MTDAPERRTLLVVDDDPAVLRFLARALRRLGYHVVTATDPESALDCVARFPVDGFILDIRLPVLWGTELLRLLRTPRTENVPAIAVTAEPGITEEDVRARGFVALLRKPFSLGELRQTVQLFVD